MKNIKVYGPGCKGCTATYEKVIATANTLDVAIDIEKITALEQIMSAGILSTPAVVVNGEIVHSGSIPDDQIVETLLTKA